MRNQEAAKPPKIKTAARSAKKKKREEQPDAVNDIRNDLSSSEWHGKNLDGIPWSIYNGASEEVLLRLPESSVHCVVTSPPYYWLRDYGVEGQIGLEETVQDYVDSLARVMEAVKRVLRPDGLLFVNLGDTYYSGKGKSHGTDRKSNKRRFGLRAVDRSGGLGIGLKRKSIIGIPWRVAIDLSTRGWVLRAPIIWHREHCLPDNPTSLLRMRATCMCRLDRGSPD
jgi:hypothetical protein